MEVKLRLNVSASEILSVRDEPGHKHTNRGRGCQSFKFNRKDDLIENHLPSRNVDFEDDLSLCRNTKYILERTSCVTNLTTHFENVSRYYYYNNGLVF